MRYLIITVFFSFLFCHAAFAQSPAPCPGQAQDEAKPTDPNEKCKPDFDKLKTAPVVFEFPDDSKPVQPAAPKEEEKKN